VVHAVHAGITLSQMCHTTLTKLNPVQQSPMLSRAFSFLVVDCFTQVFNLGGIVRDGGGNRYQSQLLTGNSQVMTKFNLGKAMFHFVPTLFHSVFLLFLGKSLIYKVCSHVPTRLT